MSAPVMTTPISAEPRGCYAVAQIQKGITVYFSSTLLLPSGFPRQQHSVFGTRCSRRPARVLMIFRWDQGIWNPWWDRQGKSWPCFCIQESTDTHPSLLVLLAHNKLANELKLSQRLSRRCRDNVIIDGQRFMRFEAFKFSKAVAVNWLILAPEWSSYVKRTVA